MTQGRPHHRTRHLSILASAGSGKTYRLSGRFLELVNAGERPDRVLASTFTRLAAGEIRDRILLRLANAALDEDTCRDLGRSIGDPSLDRARALTLLRQLVRDMHRLQIRTLDSFFAGIVHGYGLELGLPLDVRLIEEDFDARLRSEAIRGVLADPERDQLIELLRVLTEGGGDRSVASAIDQTVGGLYSFFRETDPSVWSWMTPRPLRSEVEVAEMIRTLESVPPANGHHAKAWRGDVKAARAAGHDDYDAWVEFVRKGLANRVLYGEVFHRVEVESHIAAAYAPLLEHARAVLWNQVAYRTRSTGALLARFHACYEAVKRRQRALTFSDLAAKVVEAQGSTAFDEICFRLDAQLHHVLLDEFQDTSMNQWRAIEPMTREIVADGTGDKTLFCVGDIKQSIYGWREAVPEILTSLPALLGEEQPGELIGIEQLTQSYRSAPPVIGTVNRVFENIERRGVMDGVTAAAEYWNRNFVAHSTALEDLPGWVELRTVDGSASQQKVVRLQEAARLVHELHVADPQREIGVLVRTNAAVGRVLFELGPTRLNVPATGRGGGVLTDAAAVNVLLDALRMADHPDDTVAAFNVERSPLGPVLDLDASVAGSDRTRQRRRVSRDLRRRLLEHGYAATLHELAAPIMGGADVREQRRVHQLIELAEAHDQDPSLRPAAFAAYAVAARVDDPSTSCVKVMNIHQSKGLEFDVVILADLESSFSETRGQLVAAQRRNGAGPITTLIRWVSKEARVGLPELHEVFDDHMMRVHREALCLLYVAMTRARRGLFMLIDPAKDTEKSMPATSAGLLREALSDVPKPGPSMTLFTCGDRAWLDQREGPGSEAPVPAVAPPPIELDRGSLESAASVAASPSSAASIKQAVRLSDDVATDVGDAVHRLFEMIEWIEDDVPGDDVVRAVVRRAAPHRNDAWADGVIDVFTTALAHAAVRTCMSRRATAERCRVWRELPFARVVDGSTQRGVIDRLAVEMDANGTPCRAAVIDFKTDEVTAGKAREHAEHYRTQLETYQRVAAAMLRLDARDVTMTVLYVRPGVAVELSAAAEAGPDQMELFASNS